MTDEIDDLLAIEPDAFARPYMSTRERDAVAAIRNLHAALAAATKREAALQAIVRRWAAIDGSTWHVQRELMEDTRALAAGDTGGRSE